MALADNGRGPLAVLSWSSRGPVAAGMVDGAIHRRYTVAMPSNTAGASDGPLGAFALFCAYHLGLDHQGRRRFGNIHDVARGAGVDRDQVEAALQRHGLDAGSMLNRDFDLASAQLDIQVSPAGVDLLSIAWMHWELFCSAPVVTRDWAREARDDEDENARIFGAGRPRK